MSSVLYSLKKTLEQIPHDKFVVPEDNLDLRVEVGWGNNVFSVVLFHARAVIGRWSYELDMLLYSHDYASVIGNVRAAIWVFRTGGIARVGKWRRWGKITAVVVAGIFCASCAAPILDACHPPPSFVSCEELPEATRCWATDRTDWLFYPDGHVVHEYLVGQGAEGPVLRTALCESQ